MYYKKKNFFNKYVIMGITAVILIAIIGIVVVLINSARISQEKEKKTTVDVKPEPVLTLEKSTEEPNQTSVKITATATVADEEGINTITDPEGNEKPGNKIEYTVTKNGDYTFSTYAKNGKFVEKKITINNIKERTADEPYIPEGFKHLEGTVVEGYVIVDQNQNEFVWVPVPSGQLSSDNIQNTKYNDRSTVANELQNSVAKYKGFYIGRYEGSQATLQSTNKSVLLTRKGMIPWTNIDYETASRVASEMYKDLKFKDVKTSLMSGFAWYTTLSWIDQRVPLFSSSTDRGNYSGQVYPTGTFKSDFVNNIWDLAGNVREWTTEQYVQTDTSQEDQRVLRGGSASVPNTPIKSTVQPISSKDTTWGLRPVLYKEN